MSIRCLICGVMCAASGVANASSSEGFVDTAWQEAYEEAVASIPEEIHGLRDRVKMPHLVPIATAVMEVQQIQQKVWTIETPQGAPAKSPGSACRMFMSHTEMADDALKQFRDEPYGGPTDEVNLSSGELVLSMSDLQLLDRSGLGFAFRRTFRSFSNYSGPLGMSWDHNHNQRLILDAPSVRDATRAQWHTGASIVFFYRNDNEWHTQRGAFCKLSFEGHRAIVRTAEGLRFVFEHAESRSDDLLFWRLGMVTTLHQSRGEWVNAMVYEYQPGSDRLRVVTDVFGNRVEFGYNESGLLSHLQTGRHALEYLYKDDEHLVGVISRSVAVSFDEVTDLNQKYEYYPEGLGNEGHQLMSYWPWGGQFRYFYGYEHEAPQTERARLTLVEQQDAKGGVLANWRLDYGVSNEWATTIYRPAQPAPEEHYLFSVDSQAADSALLSRRLPRERSIPGREATWQLKYNQDGLLTETTYPSGRMSKMVFQEESSDPTLRANLASIQEYPVPGVELLDMASYGTEQVFHERFPLPTLVTQYEVDPAGSKRVLETRAYRYNDYGDLVWQNNGDFPSWFVRNQYGEVALEIDGTGVIHAWQRFDHYADGDLHLDGGGLVGLELLDIGHEDAVELARWSGLPIPNDLPSRTIDPEPLARATRFTYDRLGHPLREDHPGYKRYFVVNKLGQVICTYDTRSDLALEFFDSALLPQRRAYRFSPVGDMDAYQGAEVQGLSGRFLIESFHRDARGLLARWTQTEEQFGGRRPQVLYERNPDGSVHRRRKTGEPALVVEKNPATGFEKAVYLEAEEQVLMLMSEMQHDAEGHLLSYRDELGETRSAGLDEFGRAFSSTDPSNVTTENRYDGAGRLVSVQILDPAGGILDESHSDYGLAGELLRTSRRRMVKDGSGEVVVDEWLLESEHTYDSAGRQSTSRSTHHSSTVTVAYDGLDRPVTQWAPGGDIQKFLYMGDLLAAVIDKWKSTDDEIGLSLASFTMYDDRLAPWLIVPRALGEPAAFDRATIRRHDSQGRVVLEAQPGSTVSVTAYNSIGAPIRSVSRPTDAESGTSLIVMASKYDVSGRKIESGLENEPLALIGLESAGETNLVPERVAVPQVRRFIYDGFGRLTGEIDPDGLRTRRRYGDGVLVRSLSRSRDGKTESLAFQYDALGRISSVSDGQRELQSFEYDSRGNILRSTDRSNPSHTVLVVREFDSWGALMHERVEVPELGGDESIELRWGFDHQEGITQTWIENLPENSAFWRHRTTHTDGQGRLLAIDLDQKLGFSMYGYMGPQMVRRDVPESGLAKKVALTSYAETASERWTTSGGNLPDHIFLRYHYDAQGLLEAHEFGIPSENVATTHLHAYDVHRRLSKQAVVQRVFEDRNDRMRALHDRAYLESRRTLHFDYDQAGNQLRQFRLGMRLVDEAAPTNMAGVWSLQHYSPAGLFIAEDLGAGREEAKSSTDMASNRVASMADAERVLRQYTYDPFGRLIEFEAYRDGSSLKWAVDYDAFGRALRMTARDAASGKIVQALEFASDVNNRRVLKAVFPTVAERGKASSLLRFVYEGTQPLYIYDSASPGTEQQYLWGAGYREVVMAVVPRTDVEGGSYTGYGRYFLHQNRNLDVFASTALDEEGRIRTFDIADYLGFGESATYAQISSITTEGYLLENPDVMVSHDQVLDHQSNNWRLSEPSDGMKAMLLTLEREHILQELTIWKDNFPNTFRVYVLSADSPLRNLRALVEQHRHKRDDDPAVAAWFRDGRDQRLGGPPPDMRVDHPFVVPLGERKGNRILIMWEERSDVAVREFEILTRPPASASLAHSATWRDEETGLLYHGARYRMPEMAGKFISPDPLGFAVGHNLYAYANNDPLSYYDPDGEAPVLIGAAVGAGLGAGFYAWNVWRTGEEWDWARLGIYTAAGALSGGAAAATFGAAGGGIWAATLAGAAGGGSHGALSAGGITLYETGDLSLAAKNAAISGGIGALSGAAGGAVGGGLVGQFGINVSLAGQHILAGVGGGAAGGGVSGFIHGGRTSNGWDWRDASTGGLRGMGTGAVVGGAMGGVAYGIERAAGRLNYRSHREQVALKSDKDSHHVIQDAAVRNLPGYSRENAPTVLLGRRAHDAATASQRQAGGGTYGQERRIAYDASRASGMSRRQSTMEVLKADQYFTSIGVTRSTPTRIPGNRP